MSSLSRISSVDLTSTCCGLGEATKYSCKMNGTDSMANVAARRQISHQYFNIVHHIEWLIMLGAGPDSMHRSSPTQTDYISPEERYQYG